MPTRFITYFDLLDALQEDGCPICRLLIKRTEAYLDSLLYENVNDPGTREVLRKSHGFCNWHAWRATAVSNSELGLAIIYEDLLREQIDQFESVAGRLRPRPIWGRLWARLSRKARVAHELPILAWRRAKSRCPECGIYSPFAEATLIGTILDFMADTEFAAAFENSFGLCLPHLYAAIHLGRDHPHLPQLVELQVRLFRALRWELRDLIRKHDYRYAEEARGAEAGSWRRAVELFVGKPQVFGNERPSWLAMTPPPGEAPPAAPAAVPPQGTEADQAELRAELERLRFENARLERKIKEISRE